MSGLKTWKPYRIFQRAVSLLLGVGFMITVVLGYGSAAQAASQQERVSGEKAASQERGIGSDPIAPITEKYFDLHGGSESKGTGLGQSKQSMQQRSPQRLENLTNQNRERLNAEPVDSNYSYRNSGSQSSEGLGKQVNQGLKQAKKGVQNITDAVTGQ